MNGSLRVKVGATLGAIAVTVGLLTGCSSSSSQPAKVVHLTFTNWDNGMEKVVAAWNKKNPDIQVKLVKPSSTSYTLYNKLVANNKAGTNPDISEVEYQALPAMITNKVVVDIDKYIPDISSKYSKTSLSQVKFEGKTYGLPLNACPMVFFYRKDVFDSLGLKAPTTWAEYAADADAVHKADPSTYLGNMDAGDPGWFAGLAAQAGADWWKADGSEWKVDINDAATNKVASFWEGLVNRGVVSPEPSFSTQWNTDMNTGKMVGWVGAQWSPNVFPTTAPDTAGKWVAAPLPAWNAGDKSVGFWGGETEAVTANSKHPAEAAKFVSWLSSDTDALNLLVKEVATFPALTSGQSLPVLSTPPSFMSNQADFYSVVKSQAAEAKAFSIWGPNANVTFNAYTDAISSALQNHTSFAKALDKMQSTTVNDRKKSGFTVTE